jgi:hypothetical protein
VKKTAVIISELGGAGKSQNGVYSSSRVRVVGCFGESAAVREASAAALRLVGDTAALHKIG